MPEVLDSRSALRRWVQADLARYEGGAAHTLLQYPQVRWQLRLRVTEWWCNSRTDPVGKVVGAVLRQRLQAHGVRLGYSIPINRIGPGLRLPHYGTIAVNGGALVGANCQILPDVVIGGNDRGAPVIGRSVYLGPGVKVIGEVAVGDGAVLTAGAVVVRDVPAGQTWGGVPAKQLVSRSSAGE